MRATAILMCLLAAAASAQQSQAAPSEEFLTPPPITTAPPDNEPPAPKPTVITPAEDDFLPPPNAPTPVAEPPPPPRAAPVPQSEPPPMRAAPPPPSQPALQQPPRSTGPTEPARQRALRYSRYSAGAGGSTLVLVEGLTGLVTGTMLGSAFNASDSPDRFSDGFTGAMLGGLSLGAATILYQYFVPVGRREALLAAGAATTGMMAGLTLAHSSEMDDKDRALLTFASTQAGILSVLLLTAGGEDVSAGDAGLVAAGSVYGFVLTGLIEYIRSQQSDDAYRFTPLLLAPAVGMAIGGLLAIPLEMSSASVFELTAFPLGVGGLALLVGSRIADDVIVAKTTLGAIAGTFLIVGMVNLLSGAPEAPPQKYASTVEITPVPVVMAAGRGNGSLAAGPGLFLRF